MDKFTKYYSYNQFIENFDILVMTDQQYLENKDNLDNPQRIVLVNRKGGPKEPKIPKWFQSYKQEVDARFEKIENKIEKIENKLDDSKPPKWFITYMDAFRKEMAEMMDKKLEKFAQLNDLKYEEKFKKFAKLNNLKYEE